MPTIHDSPTAAQTPLRIGMVYNLLRDVPADVIRTKSHDYFAELDSDVTIDAIEAGIRAAGYEPVRIGGIEGLVQFLAAGRTVDAVFNFAEGLWGTARESQAPGLLDAWRIPYTFSDPATLAVCMDKALTKRLWLAHDLPTAPFHVVEDDRRTSEAIDALLREDLQFPLFVKPVREGSSKGIGTHSVVRTPAELHLRVRQVHENYEQPALIEPFLDGREYTVGVLGAGDQAAVLGVIEITASRDRAVNGYDRKHPTYDRRERFLPVDDAALAARLAALGLRAYLALGCRDAGRIDIRLDAHARPQLLEINPIAGLHPEHSALTTMARWVGLDYNMLIARILHHARRRWQV